MGAGAGRKRRIRAGFLEEVTFVLSLERSWHWDRQRWGRRGWPSRWAAKECKTLLLSQTLLPSDSSTIEASNFQTDRKTRFIIHGFIDKGEESWLLDMCKVGAGSQPRGLPPALAPSANTSRPVQQVQQMSLKTWNPHIGDYLYAFKMPLFAKNKN